MTRSTVRSSFTLDRETVDAIDRPARRWETSPSAALRRIIRAATAAVEAVDGIPDPLAALDELQERIDLDEERAEAWVRDIREERDTAWA